MRHRLSTLSLLFVLPLLALWLLFSTQPVPTVQASTIVYVNQAVVGGNNNGTSWADAYGDLQTALAASPPDSDDELWVAAGLYKPTSDTNQEATFQLKSGVALYGGFVGTETERDQRDWTVNLTVLSGDIDNNDITTPAGVVTDTANIVGDNSYHVVTGSGVTNTAVLDGFIITAGKANGDSPNYSGGGMYNVGGHSSLTNATFSGNSATYDGGGMYNSNSNPTLTNVIFSNNTAELVAGMGGGMFNWNSNPSLINTTFSGNSADYGGGMYNNYYSSPTLTNITFSSNNAVSTGGGIRNTFHSNPTLTNTTFNNNSAEYGGGMANQDSNLSLTNVTFSSNSANSSGGGIYNLYSTVTVSNSIIANSLGGGDCAGPITSAGYNIDSDDSCNLTAPGDLPNTDPLLDPLADNGGYTFTHMPHEGSPAIDASDPLNCPLTDQRGMPRPNDGNGDGNAVCDIGSVEYYVPSAIVYVNQAVVGGNNNGTSWSDAYSDLQTALAASPPDSDNELWVAAGLYKPTGDTNREVTFQLKSGVALYGGFAGTETERDQRDWTVNLTVLSGDIDNNDITTPAGVVTDTANIVGDNSYHVVTGSGVTNTAVLDGFILTAGNADGSYPYNIGGGMVNENGNTNLTNVIFSGNSSGGMYNWGSSPSLTNVNFNGNSGGGMYNEYSNPSLNSVTFNSNSGGGMSNWGSSPSLTNVAFNGNSIESGGAGMHNSNNSSPNLINVTFDGNSGDGMVNSGSSPTLTNVTFRNNSGSGMGNSGSSPTLTNVTFIGNSTQGGGGMYNIESSHPSLTNVAFYNNTAFYSGGGMYNRNSSPTLTNVIFSGNSAQEGGGMYNWSSNPSLTNVTFNTNNATGGGGIHNLDGSPSLVNVTFSGNSADYGGGLLSNFSFSSFGSSNPTLTNVTFYGNSATNEGDGIYIYGGTVVVTNSIIANSLSGDDCAGDPITSAGYNIDSDGSCNLTAVGDMPNTDPLLDPLADNGGYTFTHMPRADSPAIDAGDPLNCPPTDQRGMARPNDGDGDGNAVCDIGSVEYYVPSPLSGVAIQGPITGSVQTDYIFMAVITPISATLPITYVWQTADQTVTHTGGITDTAVFSWSASGAHVLTITASNSVSSATASTTVTILGPQYLIYLPLVIKP